MGTRQTQRQCVQYFHVVTTTERIACNSNQWNGVCRPSWPSTAQEEKAVGAQPFEVVENGCYHQVIDLLDVGFGQCG